MTAAEIAAKKGAVYVTDQGVADPDEFREAGFEIVPVERDVLYELVPPGGEPHAPPG